MTKLPTDLSGLEVRAALERAGFVFRRQTGSHMVLRREQPYARVIIPDHKPVRSGTLRRIISDADLTVRTVHATARTMKRRCAGDLNYPALPDGRRSAPIEMQVVRRDAS